MAVTSAEVNITKVNILAAYLPSLEAKMLW